MTPVKPVRESLRTLVFAGCLAMAVPAGAQDRVLTIDEIYHPDARVDFSGRVPSDLTWLTDREFLLRERDPAGRTALLAVNADSGSRQPWVDATALEQALAELPDWMPMQLGRSPSGDATPGTTTTPRRSSRSGAISTYCGAQSTRTEGSVG